MVLESHRAYQSEEAYLAEQVGVFGYPDPIEQEMGMRVEGMAPWQLDRYVELHQQRNGVTVEAGGFTTFRRLQKHYGNWDAGRIVKWALSPDGHAGFYSGLPISYYSFTKDREWLTDRFLSTLRMYIANPTLNGGEPQK